MAEDLLDDISISSSDSSDSDLEDMLNELLPSKTTTSTCQTSSKGVLISSSSSTRVKSMHGLLSETFDKKDANRMQTIILKDMKNIHHMEKHPHSHAYGAIAMPLLKKGDTIQNENNTSKNLLVKVVKNLRPTVPSFNLSHVKNDSYMALLPSFQKQVRMYLKQRLEKDSDYTKEKFPFLTTVIAQK